jgi:phosphoheptose isomerase
MPSANLAEIFRDGIRQHLDIIRELEAEQDSFENAATLIAGALAAGNKVLWCGNGGSAGDAQHLAAELVGNFRQPRRPLASIALGTNLPQLTAIANDFSFGEVFEREWKRSAARATLSLESRHLAAAAMFAQLSKRRERCALRPSR